MKIASTSKPTRRHHNDSNGAYYYDCYVMQCICKRIFVSLHIIFIMIAVREEKGEKQLPTIEREEGYVDEK